MESSDEKADMLLTVFRDFAADMMGGSERHTARIVVQLVELEAPDAAYRRRPLGPPVRFWEAWRDTYDADGNALCVGRGDTRGEAIASLLAQEAH